MISLQEDISKAFDAIKKGGTLLYPTDTVWGLGCDATNAPAVKKISKLKRRIASKSFIVLLESADRLAHYVEYIPEHVYDLIEQAGRPLTVIFPKGKNVVKDVLAADGSLAIRVVKHPFCTPLIKEMGTPLLSTSANLSGASTPATFDQIAEELLKSVDYAATHFRNDISHPQPSRIIRFDKSGNFEVIRP